MDAKPVEQSRPRRRILSPSQWAGVSAAVLLFGTILAFQQYRAAYHWHETYDISRWFWHPMESNIDSGLPSVNFNLRAVADSPNGKCLWIAGDNTFLAYSADKGVTWNRLTYESGADGTTAQFRATDATFPCGGASEAATKASGLSLVPSVYAAEKAPAKQADSKPGKQPPARNPAPNQSVAQAAYQGGKSSYSILQADPIVLNFGEVNIGGASRRTLNITNSSKDKVGVAQPYYVDVGTTPSREPASPFSDSGSMLKECGVVAPGGSCRFDLAFKPKRAGVSQWNMLLQYKSDTGADTLKVTLTGKGVDAPSSTASTAAATPSAIVKPPFVSTSVAAAAPSAPGMYGLQFSNSKSNDAIVVASEDGSGTTFETTNAGRTWTWNPFTYKTAEDYAKVPNQRVRYRFFGADPRVGTEDAKPGETEIAKQDWKVVGGNCGKTVLHPPSAYRRTLLRAECAALRSQSGIPNRQRFHPISGWRSHSARSRVLQHVCQPIS